MKYRKKPVVVEAWQAAVDAEFPPDAKIRRLLSPTGAARPQWQVYDVRCDEWMDFEINDWIIRGVKGEFYPCKVDVFAATYEPVEKSTCPDCGKTEGHRDGCVYESPLPEGFTSVSTHPKFEEWWKEFGEKLAEDPQMTPYYVALGAWASSIRREGSKDDG